MTDTSSLALRESTEILVAPGESTEIMVATGVMPIVSPADAQAQMRAYIELVEAVLTPADYQEIPDRKKVNGRWVDGTKRFKKKSAVKKLQTFFGFSLSCTAMQRFELEDGHFAFAVTARATSPNGRFVEAIGACSTMEERFDVVRKDKVWDENARRMVAQLEPEAVYQARLKKALARGFHDVISTAETRATNRAAMNLIGSGEVTADEIQRETRKVDPEQTYEPPPRSGGGAPPEGGARRATASAEKPQAPIDDEPASTSADPQARQKDALSKMIFALANTLNLNDADRRIVQAQHGIKTMSDLRNVTVEQLKAFADDLRKRNSA